MTGNNNVYKTIWKNGNKEYNEKYICCFITIWNLISAKSHKCGRVVLFLTSVYFAISNAYCYFPILFMYNALYFPTFIFTLYVPFYPFFLIDHNQKRMLLIKWVFFFWKLKNISLLFSTFWKWSNSQRFLDVEYSSIVSTSPSVVNINDEIDNVDLTLFNVVNFNVDIHNLVSTLIWHCPTSWRHITLTTTLRSR